MHFKDHAMRKTMQAVDGTGLAGQCGPPPLPPLLPPQQAGAPHATSHPIPMFRYCPEHSLLLLYSHPPAR